MGWILVLACTIGQAGDVLGVSSCMSTGCHGKPESAGRPAWESSYSVWFNRDLHSNAAAVLFEKRSRAIVGALSGSELHAAEYVTFLQQNCTDCHATSHEVPQLVEGVSCESCHGPARDWVSSHTLKSKGRSGMLDTQNLHRRAEICAKCHVGGRKDKAQPHDVNHDLIAAGHPRLTFEFTAYLRSMPSHWDTVRDQSRPGFASESWSAGQLATAQASLRLLEQRTHGPLWPEFAEYDCYGCHHSLQGDRAVAKGPLGRPKWGVWSYPMLDLIARTNGDPAAVSSLTRLRDEMEKPAPKLETIRELASKASQSLEHRPLDAGQLLSTVNGELESWRHWEELMQGYLAARAMSDQPLRVKLERLLDLKPNGE